MARKLSHALDRKVQYVDIPPEAMDALLGVGLPRWQALGLNEDYAHYRRGEASAIPSGVQDATGVPPHSFDYFACDYAPAFPVGIILAVNNCASGVNAVMKVILFGATGMVGQGVLRECLRDENVDNVLVIGRNSTGQTHPKLSELRRPDMFDFGGVAVELQGYNACFFCLGVSSAGMAEAEYTRLTYDLTIGWARELAQINPAMTFIYVSGAGTGGKSMWAQVKGRTEKALLELFPKSYMFRIGAVRAMHGETSKTRWTRIMYSVSRPLWPLVQAIAPGAIVTTEELGRAMIHVARSGAPKRVLENRDLRALAS